MRNIRQYIRRTLILALTAVFFSVGAVPAHTFAAEGLSGEALLRLKQDAAWVDYTKPQGCGGGAVDLPNGTPDENGQAIFNFFVGKGLQPFQAAGIIGNMVVESGLLPQRLQGTGPNTITLASVAAMSGSGWGLVQWTPAGKFIRYSVPPYMDTTTAPYESANNLGTQVDFIWEQLQGKTHIPEGQAGIDIKATPNIEEAVLAFQGNRTGAPSPAGKHYIGYERPADQTGSVKLRTQYARAALAKYGSGAGGAADAVGSISTGGTAGTCSGTGDLVVMTYNILGADLAPDWRGRLDKVAKTIEGKQPHIMGFQEVYDGALEGLQSRLASKYTGFPKPNNEGDGAKRPIYWDKSMFTLVRSGSYDIPKTIPVPTPWVVLKHNASGQTFFVTNAHLMVGNSRSDANLRAKGAERMLAGIERNNTEKSPVIMTGDYNSTCEKTRDTEDADTIPCAQFRRAGYETAYETAEVKINAEYSTSHGGIDSLSKRGRRIDHVFYKKDSIPSVAKWENVIDENTQFASDHTPVVATLRAGIGGEAGADGWVWPVKGNIQTGPCWNTYLPGYGNHAGMDINSTVPGNQAIAAHSGTVVKANAVDNGPAGKYVTIRTDGNPTLWYSYQHLASISVNVGDKVAAGQTVVGIIGTTGRVFGGGAGHLHFVVAVSNTLGSYSNNTQTRDPLKYLPKQAPDNYKCSGGSASQL